MSAKYYCAGLEAYGVNGFTNDFFASHDGSPTGTGDFTNAGRSDRPKSRQDTDMDSFRLKCQRVARCLHHNLSLCVLFVTLTAPSIAAAFDPADIPGLKLRYDIHSLATNDGTIITTLKDSSGNGYNASAAAGGTVWSNNLIELNNLGHLTFRQVSHYVATHPTLPQPNTAFMVARVRPVAQNWYFLLGGGNSIYQNPTRIGVSADSTFCDATTYTGTNWVIYEYQFNSVDSLVRTNGVRAWSGASANPGSASQPKTLLFARSDGGNEGYGDLAYFLFYSGALTTTQSSNVVSWLNDRFHVFGYGAPPPAGPPWYASPTGKNSSDADGSINNPWDIVTALRATNSIKPGDTLYLRGGTYTHYAVHPKVYLAGTSNAPITVCPYRDEKVIIATAGDAASQQTGSTLEFYGSYCILRDVEVCNFATNRYNISAVNSTHARGVSIYSAYNKMINCIIHDTGEGIWIAGDATNTEVYGCWTFNNGSQNLSTTNLDGSPRTPDSRGHGHNFYARSPIPTTLIAENFILNAFDAGIQCYTTHGVPLIGFRLEGNVCFGNGRWSASGDLAWQFVVGGGTAADRIQVYTNFVVESDLGANSSFFGAGFPGDISTGNGSIEFVGNHLIGDYHYITCWTNVVYTNNYLQGRHTFSYNTFPDPDKAGTHRTGTEVYTWDRNTYNLSANWGGGAWQVSTNCYHMSFQQWTNASGLDVNSSFSTSMPNTAEVYVRPNKYDTTRAHVIVINWPSNNTVKADCSAILKTGDNYQVLNGQDPLAGPILTGTYSNAITLPMTNLSVAIPTGLTNPPGLTNAQVYVGPFFGIFIVNRISYALAAPSQLRVNGLVP